MAKKEGKARWQSKPWHRTSRDCVAQADSNAQARATSHKGNILGQSMSSDGEAARTKKKGDAQAAMAKHLPRHLTSRGGVS